jgi:hypothetical protein
MLHDDYGAGLRAPRRMGSVLVYASVGLTSAISGAAVALQLAAAGEYFRRPAGAAISAAIAAAPMDKPRLPPAAQTMTAARPGIVSAPSASKPAPSAPTRTSAPLDERELTFAWGYAQRHPGAPARHAEAHVDPALASAPTQGAARVAKSEPRRPPKRQHTSAAPRNTVGFAPSRFVAGFQGDPHQELGYTEQRYPNGFRIFDRAQSPPGLRRRSPTPPPRT